MEFIPSSYLTMLFLFLIGIYLCIHNFLVLREYASSESWPAVMGRLQHHRLSAFINTKGGKKTYSVRVAYEYTVNGKVYTSERLKIWPGDFSSAVEADVIIKNLSSSPLVQVFYDPSNPAKAVLLRGTGGRKYTLAFWGVMLIAISTYVVFSEWGLFINWLSIKFE